MPKSVRVDTVVTEIQRAVGITHPPVKLVEAAAEAVKSLASEYSRDQSLEYAERNAKRIRQELSKRLSSDLISVFGYFSSISISDVSEEYIHGSCYILPSDGDDIKKAKLNRSKIDRIEANINSLSYSEFETFCGKILGILGVEKPVVTRSSNDQGIDFFGLWPHQSYLIDSVMPPGMERQLRTWIFGQAKKYDKTKITTSEIRELVGSVALARSNTFSSYISEFSDLVVRPCDPVFQFFMTTGRATSDVMGLMTRAGTIFMDGHLSAVFLADRAGTLGIQFDDIEAFSDWLRGD